MLQHFFLWAESTDTWSGFEFLSFTDQVKNGCSCSLFVNLYFNFHSNETRKKKETHQLQLVFYSFYPLKSSSECGFLLLYLSTIPAKCAQLSLKSRHSLVFLSKSTYSILYDQSANSLTLSLQLLIIKLCYLSQEKFRARAVLKKKSSNRFVRTWRNTNLVQVMLSYSPRVVTRKISNYVWHSTLC